MSSFNDVVRPTMIPYAFSEVPIPLLVLHKKVVARVEKMEGLKEAKWNSRTREVTVIYDALVTSACNIKHFVA